MQQHEDELLCRLSTSYSSTTPSPCWPLLAGLLSLLAPSSPCAAAPESPTPPQRGETMEGRAWKSSSPSRSCEHRSGAGRRGRPQWWVSSGSASAGVRDSTAAAAGDQATSAGEAMQRGFRGGGDLRAPPLSILGE